MTRKQKWQILRALPASLDDATWYFIVNLLDYMVKDFSTIKPTPKPTNGQLLYNKYGR